VGVEKPKANVIGIGILIYKSVMVAVVGGPV
jgi:hypothetical protein